MRVLVYEAGYQGHVFTYLRLLLPALREVTDDVTVAIPENSVDTDEYRQQLAPLTGLVKFDPSIDVNLFDPSEVIASLVQTIKRTKAEYVYVPRADGIVQVLGMRRATGGTVVPRDIPIEGLMLRGSFAYPQEDLLAKLKAIMTLQAVKMSRWSVLHHLDPIAYAAIQRCGGQVARQCRLMPDPVEPPKIRDRAAARRFLGLPEDGRYIGFAGGADRRKGADLLIRAFARAKIGDRDRLLIVGKLAGDIKAMVEGEFSSLHRSQRLVLLDRYVTDDELLLSISAMDVVCTPYPRHIGSASFIIRAAAAERLVLAADFGWMGTIVPQFGLGRTCDVTDTDEFAKQIALTLDQSASYQITDAGARFVEFHSVSNFQAAWTAEIRRRLDRDPSNSSRTWEWATAGAAQPSHPSKTRMG